MSTNSLPASKTSTLLASTRVAGISDCDLHSLLESKAESEKCKSDKTSDKTYVNTKISDNECDTGCINAVKIGNKCVDACEAGCGEYKNACGDGCGSNDKKGVCCGTVSQCVWGILLMIMSIGGLIFTPLDLMLWEKLNMRPGFPPFDWWSDPPDEVKLRAYVFNVTNHERFLMGLDEKINVEEIGPIVYLEKLLHSNITFNENGTLTYTAKRFPIYLEDENSVDLNATLIIPNLAVLGMASFLHNAPYFVRTGFRFLVNTRGSPLFVKKTVYEYLWDYKDGVLDTSKSLAPGLVPVDNMGMLARIYADFTDEINVYIGQDYGHEKFFQMNKFRGQPQLPGYDPEVCPDRIFGSTEGVMYKQHISKADVLLYWRKTVCKLMPLYFDQELTIDDVPVYRFNLSESVYERVKNGTDCYDTVPSLPAGISDASKCYFDFPMVISYPHFYTGDPPKDAYVTGLQPDQQKHNSYVIVEPLTGTPFRSVARMQSNLRVHDLSGFSKEFDQFSNLILPLFWAEYNQEGLPTHIRLTIYTMVVILPKLGTAISILFILIASYLLFKQFYIHKLKSESLNAAFKLKNKNVNSLARSKLFAYEKEKFLRKA